MRIKLHIAESFRVGPQNQPIFYLKFGPTNKKVGHPWPKGVILTFRQILTLKYILIPI